MNSGSLHAAERYDLGKANFAFKVASISFSDSVASNLDINNGYYGGLEFYLPLSSDGYLGIESGYAYSDGTVGGTKTELMYIPVEINLKASIEASPHLVFAFGAGIAGIYADMDQTGVITASVDDTLYGAQLFFDMNFVFSAFLIGVHGKYQYTSEFNNQDFSLTNFRVGAQLGFRF